MVAVGSMTSVGTEPSLVRSEIGTLMAMVWTLKPWTPLTPAAAADGMRWAAWNGRSVPRSKIEPRSTWNASERWPAKTVRPPLTACTA